MKSIIEMKFYVFYISVFLTLFGFGLHAQGSLSSKRVNKWYVPDFATLQYAGSTGFISVGGGYSIFKNKANMDILFGYVPVFAGGLPIETISLKFTGAVWRVPVNNRVGLNPLSIGTFFCYTPGREYSSELPSWYPTGYYWWSEAIRVNIFIGGGGDITLINSRRISKLNFYYELGTNEIKLVSYIQNTKVLTLGDILHAGIGMRIHFKK
jgi:hypothetical protein